MTARKTAPKAVEPEQITLLPLDQPRSIVLMQSARKYIYTLRRVLTADWEKYFVGIVNQVRNLDGMREQIFESESALLELADAVIASVQVPTLPIHENGYPLNQRLAVGQALCSVSAAMGDDDTTVLLNACWSADAEGKMQLFKGLVHRFNQPTIDQVKRWNYELARVRVRGTSKDGLTTFPSRQLAAMRIYDELIVSVEGYGLTAGMLTGVEAIRREMDGLHKAEAAMQLLGGSEVTIL